MGAPPPLHLRQEIFALGGRHLGDALGGAKRELQADGLSADRRRLLQAVIRHLEPGASFSSPPASTDLPEPRGRRNWRPIAYGAVLFVAAVWILTLAVRILG